MKKFALLAGLLLSGCASLTSTGPNLSAIQNYQGATVVSVTTASAHQMLVDLRTRTSTKLSADIDLLMNHSDAGDHILRAGDRIVIEVTSWSVAAGATGDHSVTNTWSFEVNAAGDVNLPYVGHPVHVAGLTLPESQTSIVDIYTHRKVFLSPSVHVSLDEKSPAHGVLVTGSVGSPKVVPWIAGGMTIAQALTIGFGNGTSMGGQQSDLNGQTSATTVTIVRQGLDPIDLPLDEALKRDIPVTENDKLIVSHKPAVQVTVLGGGIGNGLMGFDQHPALAQAIAQAKGLNPGTADAKLIFVYRNNGSPMLYSFAFKSPDGQFAAQQFPLMDGDIVYVTTAPLVPVEQVMAAIMPALSMASIAR